MSIRVSRIPGLPNSDHEAIICQEYGTRIGMYVGTILTQSVAARLCLIEDQPA